MGGAWSNGAWSGDSSSSSTTVGKFAVPCDPATTIIGSSLHYAMDQVRPGVLQFPPLKTPIVANADIKTNPPGAMTIANTGNSGTWSISGGVLLMVASVGTAREWNAATQDATASYRTHTVQWNARRVKVLIARIAAPTATVNYRITYIFVKKNGSLTPVGRIGVGFSGGNPVVYSDGASLSSTPTTITTGQRDAGVWVRISLTDTDIEVDYNTSSSSTPPTSGWVNNGRSAAVFTAGDSIDVGYTQAHGTDLATAYTGRILYYDDTAFQRILADERPGFGSYTPNTAVALGFPTTPDTVRLIDSADLGSAVLPNVTALRQVLADAANRYSLNGATWTFSLTGANSASPTVATTFQSAASLTAKEAGSDTAASAHQYWCLAAKCTTSGGTGSGTGITGGTLDLPSIFMKAA